MSKSYFSNSVFCRFFLVICCFSLFLSMRVGIPICFATSNDGSHTESASIKDANDEIGSNSPKDTAALIDAILCKGYEYDFLYSNSPFTMYDSLLIQDEIFSELEKRPDAGSELLKKIFYAS